ncbi:UBN2_3 domain-containing protein [Senna tora]|uniref:UBN2_3 domain-containing protein n=1 Tax=Senna tora TaxID=362788 RepID=A0A834SPZ8_9FABA|nr:UBN2_3 domain-containing protein [Senna tora]
MDANRRRDPTYIHPSDNPGAQIVNRLLTLNNYLVWKRAIRIALKAKNKLGFIDGSCLPPTDASSEKYFKWSDADSMVVSWLHHSMTKDLMEAYMFTPSARELWLELEEKFGATDKSHIYDLRKQLIQMMQVKNTYNSSSKKKDYGKKGDRFCVHCNKPGHLEEACFKKHGYPEWFKEYKNKKTQQNTTLAATNTTNATEMQQKSSESNLNSALIAQMVQMEVQKLMKSKNTVQESPVSTSYFADFAGNLSNSALKYSDNWVVDSGASSHIIGPIE